MDFASATDTVDAVFDAMGAPAVYTSPAGETTDCTAVAWTPQDARRRRGATIGGFELADRASFVMVRKAEVADPQSGGRFVITPEDGPASTWEIGEDAPVPHDSRGLAWRCGAEQIA